MAVKVNRMFRFRLKNEFRVLNHLHGRKMYWRTLVRFLYTTSLNTTDLVNIARKYTFSNPANTHAQCQQYNQKKVWSMFKVNSKYKYDVVLVPLLLTLNRFHTSHIDLVFVSLILNREIFSWKWTIRTLDARLTFTSLKQGKETIEKGVNYVRS